MKNIETNKLTKTNYRLELIKSLTDQGVNQYAAEKIVSLRDNDNPVKKIMIFHDMFNGINSDVSYPEVMTFNYELRNEDIKYLFESLRDENCKVENIELEAYKENSETETLVKTLVETLVENVVNYDCKIKSIDICGCKSGDDILKKLSESFVRLTSISLSDCEITDKAIKNLSEDLLNESCKLVNIALERNRITAAGAKDLAESLSNPACKVEKINIEGNQIGISGIEALVKALESSKLKASRNVHIYFDREESKEEICYSKNPDTKIIAIISEKLVEEKSQQIS
ncbi:MAG: hypothetical protein EBS06_00825 [Proteobacteria bacterium]|nr:hypothetical protein [Pseudomonadota bacterium]